MYGVIFTNFRDYLVAAHGPATASAVFEAEPEYLLSQAYPDESLGRLVALASARTGLEADETVETRIHELVRETDERTYLLRGDLACAFDVSFSAD